MTITVNGPGFSVNFPDGTTPDVIDKAMRDAHAKVQGGAPSPQGTPIPATGMQTADSGPAPQYTGTEADILPTSQAIQGKVDPYKDPGGLAQRLANSVTFGLADRIGAGVGALVGGPSYADGLKAARERSDQFAADHPVAAAAADVGGAAMLPIGAIAAAPKGAGLITKMAYGAGTGGVLGAASGAGNSRDWTDLKQLGYDTALGAGTGSLIGGSIPAVGAGVGKAYRTVADALTKPAVSPSRSASRALDDAMRADGYQAIRSKLDALGPEGMLPDAGPSLQGLGQGVAVRPGDAKSVLVNALKDRNAGAGGRISSDIDAALGPGSSAIIDTQAIKAARSTEHQDLPKIFANAPPVDTSQVLATIGQRLNKAVGPERDALLKARSYLLDRDPNGIPLPISDAEKLSNAKTALDDMIQYGDPTIGLEKGAAQKAEGSIKLVRAQLNNQLRTQVPGYSAVMDKSSALAGEANALERGTGLFKADPLNHPDVVAAEFAKLTPEQQAAMRSGTRSQIEMGLDNRENDRVGLNAILKGETDWPRRNLATVYGESPTAQVYGAKSREATFADTYNKIVENSQTAQRNAAAEALKDKTIMSNPNLTSASPTGLAMAGVKKLAGFVLGGINSENAAVRDSALAHLLSLKGPERDKLLDLLMQVQGVGDRNAVTGGLIGNLVAGGAGTTANYVSSPSAGQRTSR